LAIGLKLPIKNLSDVAGAATFAGGASALPKFVGLPAVPASLDTLRIILSTSVGVALIAALQTILASRIACDSYRCRVDAYEEDNPNRLVVGLGMGNAVSGLFGGFGGCGLIPNTLLNGNSGGEGYASSFSYSICLALFVVVFAPIIGIHIYIHMYICIYK
jgi:SulP family sulfate permease